MQVPRHMESATVTRCCMVASNSSFKEARYQGQEPKSALKTELKETAGAQEIPPADGYTSLQSHIKRSHSDAGIGFVEEGVEQSHRKFKECSSCIIITDQVRISEDEWNQVCRNVQGFSGSFFVRIIG